MTYNKNIFAKSYSLLLLIILFFNSTITNAQCDLSIDTGDASVPLAGTGHYNLDIEGRENLFSDFRWEIVPSDAAIPKTNISLNTTKQADLYWIKPGHHQIRVNYYDKTYNRQCTTIVDVFVSEDIEMPENAITVSSCKFALLMRYEPPPGITYYWQSTANGTSTENNSKTITLNTGTEYFLRAKIDSNNIWSKTSRRAEFHINPNDYLVWYLDADDDELGNPNYFVLQCSNPSTSNVRYVLDNTDTDDGVPDFDVDDAYLSSGNNEFHWTQDIRYDIKGKVTGNTKTYFDDLGRPDVSVSKDMVTKKIWGTETLYDNLGRAEKSSFIAPSNLLSLDKVHFFNTSSQDNNSSSIPVNLTVSNITTSQTVKVTNTLTATGVINPGLNVNFIGKTVILGNNFSVTATSGGTFTATASNVEEESSNSLLSNYYTDNNTEEPYQATATHPFTQNNYDVLNPGNIINVVGGNKINGEWKTGYSYTVPAAQETYYVYGSDYYDGAISAGKEEVITKFYKSVSVDANGIENVAFSDGEGKLLASARSGGAVSYPVVSLIGMQGFVDVHIPAGIANNQINLIGGASLYKIYDLKTGAITSNIIGGNAYRIEALTTPLTDPKTYIASGVPSYDAGALGITYNVNYYDYAVNVYNKTGQLIKSIQPNGYVSNSSIVSSPTHMTSSNFASTYKYNGLGQLIETSSPDEGISKFAYRNDGQIRYSQSALQTDTKVSYTDYDTLGRPIESGVITGSSGIWASAIANSDGTLITGTRSEQTFIVYDYSENNTTSVAIPTTPNDLTLAGVLTTAGISTTNYIQNNLSGNVAVTYTKPESTISAITWYSYDLYGRAEWVVQYNEGIGAKTIHYEYDYKGNAKKVLFQKDKTAELFVHQYTYNANDVLTKVETSTNNTTFITHVDYSYYKTGELKRVSFSQGAQGLDYVYTLGGQLKSINHPSLEASKDPGGDVNDLFGLTLDYYNGDYLRTGRNITSSPTIGQDYNGNIKAARWANRGVAADYSGSSANQKGYLYNYDRNNWLTGATFGNTNSSTAVISPSSNFAEGGLTYDANGNIKSLQRTNEVGTTIDNLTYNYNNTGSNQLNSLTENAAITADVNDIENQAPGNYIYDAIGQLKQNVSENLYYFYNTQGLVTEVKKGSNTIVKFFYNERGQRTKKESYDTANFTLQSTTFYELDLAGNTLAVYNLPVGGTISQSDLIIYGLDRIGTLTRAGTIKYEIKDHLGNVRVVLLRIQGNFVTIGSYADYYPFGELLPSRNSLNYRYAFQGQELDKETGMEAFQLRLWDGRIGRWLSPDPYGQHSSPYLGMGNNPIGTIDPDGGWEWEISARWHAFWSGGKAFQSSQGDWGVQTAGKSSDGMYIQTNFGGERYDVYRQAAAEKYMDALADYRTFHPSEFGDISLWDENFEGGRLSSIASAFQLVTPSMPAMNAYKASKSGITIFGKDASTLSNAGRIVEESGVHKVLVHGEVDKFVINNTRYSAKEVAKMMLKTGFKKGTPIECIACSTGKYADGAAYQLGRYLKSPVIAPSDLVRAVDFNQYVIKDGGVWRFFP